MKAIVVTTILTLGCSAEVPSVASPSSSPPPAPPSPEIPLVPEAPVPERLSRKEVVDGLNLLFWSDRLLIESVRYNSIDTCNVYSDKARNAIDRLRSGNGEDDATIALALNVARRCVSCLESSWFSCWDMPQLLRELGATSENRKTDKPLLTGRDRSKARGRAMSSAGRIAKAVRGVCAAHPGEMARELNDDVYELEQLAFALDPPDDNLDFVAASLSAATECTKNVEHYYDHARMGLEKMAVNPAGRPRPID